MIEVLPRSLPDHAASALKRDGVALFSGLLAGAALHALEAELAALTVGDSAYGLRGLLGRLPALRKLLDTPPLRVLVTAVAGSTARPVRAIFFDKTAAHNWGVPWHQDRTIAVRARAELLGFGPWTVKQGVDHVEPPAALLERMVALRIHLDAAAADNGALAVLPGTHRRGRLTQADIRPIAAGGGSVLCAACAGEVLAMKPLLLHSSRKATRPGHRRVVHVEFSPDALPAPLDWAE